MIRIKWVSRLIGVVSVILSGCAHEDRPVVFIGDSIVQLWDIETTLPHLTSVNLGKSGSGISYIEERSNSLGGSEVVAVMGINDLFFLSDDKVGEYALRYLEAFNNLGAARIYLFEVLPACTGGAEGLNRRIRCFNDMVDAALSQYPSIIRIPVFDQFMSATGSMPDPSLYTDGLHPAAEGYFIMAAALQRRMPHRHG